MAFQAPQDEGYSEDPLTMQVSGGVGSRRVEPEVQQWLTGMSVEDRARLALNIINGLPTSTVYNIIETLRPRLFLNFFDLLPTEVCLKILGYLDPVSLISTAQASRDWMSLSMDWKLWEHLYYLEGWRTVPTELVQFERELASRRTTPSRARPSLDEGDQHTHKKRATPKLVSAVLSRDVDSEMQDVDTILENIQPSLFGRKAPRIKEPMSTPSELIANNLKSATVQSTSPAIKQLPVENNRQPFPVQSTSRREPLSTKPGGCLDLSFMSSLVVRDHEDNTEKLNWQYLYTQRRRLEANWEAEKFVNFQLPHPKHLDEAHTECIYTIQHSGKYLVSGSRDKTLRIWDLDTRRLVREPLKGHNGSVLCLQFDADPEEDLIVSGSSDSTVALWRFSTGKLLQVLRKAHRESVLNVRFDRRILVTCSKDKTIKIFNRRPMHPGDVGYPDNSHAVRPVPTILNNYGFNPSPSSGLPIKPPYTMIGCLDGHGAAVNAVQIYNDEIVSASGDRNVKVWDWPLGLCTRTLVGHQKGIACVQYDGRRIVSGSSDNEVKIFDKETGLEVASLRAHTSLVRTVQAGFGDLPHSAEEDRADARHVDDEYFRAVDAGSVPRTVTRGRTRNAGSRRPEDIMAYGAKLPPGGGGGRYGRIVSGSYDETVIIWRRDKEGVWKAQHTLRQEDAAVAAAREFGNSRVQHSSTDESNNGSPPPTGSQAYYHLMINTVVPQGPHALRQALASHPQLMQYHYLHVAISAEPVHLVRNQLRSIVAQALARQQILIAQQLINSQLDTPNSGSAPAVAGSEHQAHSSGVAAAAVPPLAPISPAPAASLPQTQAGLPPPLVQAPDAALADEQQSQTSAPSLAQTQAQAQAQAQAQQAQAQAQQPPLPLPANLARVFKLQFDARRIICCSQTPIIVGWDFANGDEKIIEASRFFAPVD